MQLVLLGVSAVAVLLGGIACICRPGSIYKNKPQEQNPMEGKRVRFVSDESLPEEADGVRGYLEVTGEATCKSDFYEKVVKRTMDIVLSFLGLVLLAPVFGVLSLWIFIDDPGPVVFVQKRIGKNKRFFKLHKFRSMKMSAPHDVPTHMLDNPGEYITRAGRFIRGHSLDELPQIWDIFIGNMSIIGPRPGLWNQDLLTAYREESGANDVRPGLTGWAQINGRDTISLEEKTRLDGEYVSELKKGKGLAMDVKCFLGSLGVFWGDKKSIKR